MVVVNNSASAQAVQIPVWQLGIRDEDRLTRVMMTTLEGYNVGALDYEVVDGVLELELSGPAECYWCPIRSAIIGRECCKD